MNVLLITFSFPPAGGVGVLRALSLAKYLPESGLNVHVLTARNAPAVGRDDSLLAQVPASVSVHRTWTLDLPFALRKRIKKILTRQPAGASSTPATPARRPGLLGRLRSFIANLLLPDPQIGWLPFALPAARRLIRTHHIDAVLITVPPFSSVKLAPALRKAFPHLPIVVDFRDEWLTTTLQLVSFNSNPRARAVAERTERDAVTTATRVVMVTEAAAAELRKRYPDQPAGKFTCIPNGFETPQPHDTARPDDSGTVVLTYLGTVYGSTDPLTLVAAIRTLAPQIRERLRIRFIGHIETEAYRAALASVPDVVQLAGFMPQAKALRELRLSAFALLITHDPINVSAKFYDYLGAGIPILAVVHPQGEVRRLLDLTGAGRWADASDPAAIAALLTHAVNHPDAAITPHPGIIASFHRRPLAARYAALLQQLVSPGDAP